MILSMALYFLYPATKNLPTRENDIEGADFFWTDAGGKSYTVEADYVIETQAGWYKLIVVKGRYYLDAGRKNYVNLSSETALFNEKKNIMELKGNVEFRSSEGYKATSDSMYLDLNQKTAYTADKVTLNGMQGTTVSQKGMIMYMGVKKILLYGPVTSIFNSTTSQSPIKVESRTVEADYGSRPLSKLPHDEQSLEDEKSSSSSVELAHEPRIILKSTTPLTSGVELGKMSITYHENVWVSQANAFDLYCDKARIFYAKNEQSKYIIKQIQFLGKVRVVRGERIAAGDFGALDPQNKVMILRGNVALKEKDAYLEGEEVHYNTGNGIFTVHKAKQSKHTSGKQDRIKVILEATRDDHSKRH